MDETFFVLTNDDAGGQQPERFEELLDFLAQVQVPATFFVIPAAGGEQLDKKPQWLNLLHRALDEGHELQLHGFVHGAFEFGVPPDFMLDIMPDQKARWAQEPQAIQADHILDILTDKLTRGKEIFHRALGYEPLGFRSGCLAICDNMHRALAGLGFHWTSNLVVNPMGWRYINRQYAAGEPWQPDVPPHPFTYQAGLVEVPMLSEYTWYLREADLDRHFDLARADWDKAGPASGVFVTLSHYYAMTGEWSTGLRVYERLFDHVQEQDNVKFCTVSQLLEHHRLPSPLEPV